MRTVKPIIASNGLAILLTIVVLLPVAAVMAYIITSPLDRGLANLGIWLHERGEWSFPVFDTELRFAKIGFAIRSVVIAVGISFLYFSISNWLNQGMARARAPQSPGRQSAPTARRNHRSGCHHHRRLCAAPVH